MAVLNDMEHFHPLADAMGRMPQTGQKGIYLKQQLKDKLIERRQYFEEHRADLSWPQNWKWDREESHKRKPLAERRRGPELR